MKTILAVCGLDGRRDSLALLTKAIDERRPEVVLFAGGLFRPHSGKELQDDGLNRNGAELSLLESLLSLTASKRCLLAVIPGPRDGPLQSFLRTSIRAEVRYRGVKVVHDAVMTVNGNLAISGIAGELAQSEDACEPVIRCSRETAGYFLRPFQAARAPHKVLLLAVPPVGVLGGKSGNLIVRSLVETYRPRLCVTAGDTARRGVQRVARTLIVNPGRLSDGSAAWIDLNRTAAEQVELLDLRAGDSPAAQGAALARRRFVRVSGPQAGSIPVFSLEARARNAGGHVQLDFDCRTNAPAPKKPRPVGGAAESAARHKRCSTASRNPPVPNGEATGIPPVAVVA